DSAFPKTSGFDLADIGTQGGAQAYGQLLGDIMDNPKLRPLFDQPVSALARGLQREGTLDPVDRAITHTRQAGVGAFLIARLPAFPDADVELLLEAKRDLTGPRNVFRAAVNQYAAEIQPLSWDGPDFEADLRDLHETVDLARIALVEALTATSLGRSIARALREPLGAAGATAAITVDMGSLVPALASLADHAEAVSSAIGGLSLSALAAAILGETGKAKATRQGLRTDELFYLVELDRRI
ncbi:MAG: hypothetical protein OSB43_19565, partial [Nocardioides sp.]|uniref:hypothetical protein n=1 Tax=Nocardioides sp. TaxID=35761 RepID=UPI002397E3F3